MVTVPVKLALFVLLSSPWLPFGRSAPDLRALFVPPHAPLSNYDVLVSDETIEVLTSRLRESMPRSLVPATGAWTIERLEPLDAFGSDGRYDRYRLARLFGARRPQVARGPLIHDRRTIGSVTLISPYPNAALTRLLEGTLVILTIIRNPTTRGLDLLPPRVVEFR